MPNLRKFVDTLNKSNLHAASSYVFDWPEVFPSIENIDPGSLNRFGHAVIQNITVTGVDHTELKLAIDGHEIPVLSTPKLASSMTMTLLLDKNIVDGTYGKLLKMIYLDNALGTTGGLHHTNYPVKTGTSKIARLYPLNMSYTKAGFVLVNQPGFVLDKQPCMVIHYPRVKHISELTFDSSSSEISKCTLDIVFAWLDTEPTK